MRRPLAIVASMGMTGLSAVAVVAGAVPAGAQVAASQADYRGYSTGSVVHVGVLGGGAGGLIGGSRLVDTEVAFSGATVASQGTGGVTFGPGAAGGTVVNEYGAVVQPTLPNTGLDANLRGDRSFARGSALEIGLANNLPNDANQLILSGKARASAPPSTDLIRREIGPIKIDGIAYASLLRGEAQARFREDRNCFVGQPLSLGTGYAADAQLLGSGGAANEPFTTPILAADASTPERRVSQSRSTTRLIPQVDVNGNKLGDNFGLMTETRQTIAPVTLFKGTPTQLTLEFLGEWVLRSVATGVGGSAGNYVFYGPGTVTPSTPVVRIISGINPALGSITELTLQQLLGPSGLVIPIPGVAEVAVGEDPRAIGGNASTSPQLAGDGTLAAGAVDVARVTLLDGSLLDVRVGHMEARAQVPAGGIRCEIPVTKTADKPNVNAGEQFTYTITVTNPFGDCTLENVRVVDTIAVPNSVKFSVIGTNPAATVSSDSRTITFDNIGSIPPNSSKAATIQVQVASNSGSGLFTDTARATGTCATGTGNGEARINVPASGEVTVQLPQAGSGGTQLPRTGVDDLPQNAPAPAQLPRTGGESGALMAGLLLAGAAVLRRLVVRAT
ncbi:MAG: DUF11 domain-containing protein [Acidimicrobiales bacterium]